MLLVGIRCNQARINGKPCTANQASRNTRLDDLLVLTLASGASRWTFRRGRIRWRDRDRILVRQGGSRGSTTADKVRYIGANVSQAWAAGSAFMLTQALLGFLPDAPRNKLYVDPLLPAWLPDLTMRNLRIARHKVDIRFWRDDAQTAFEGNQGEPELVERCEIASKIAQLRAPSDLTPSQMAQFT
jgi:hypothetical protein